MKRMRFVAWYGSALYRESSHGACLHSERLRVLEPGQLHPGRAARRACRIPLTPLPAGRGGGENWLSTKEEALQEKGISLDELIELGSPDPEEIYAGKSTPENRMRSRLFFDF